MPTPRPIAVTSVALSPALRDAVAQAHANRFDGLLIPARSGETTLSELSVTGRHEVRNLIAGNRLQLVGIAADLGPAGFGQGVDIDRLLNALSKLLDAAAGLGAPLVSLDLGRLPAAPPPAVPMKPEVTEAMAGLLIVPSSKKESSAAVTPDPPFAIDTAALSLVTTALVELGTLADRRGVIVALHSSLSPLASVTQALRSAACPWFGIDLDPVAVLRDAADFDDVFNTLAPDFRHVRGRDAVRGDGGRTKTVPIARGDVSWREFAARLDASNYSGALTIDPIDLPDPASSATAGLKWLRENR